jgi:hypothetical protein
MEAQDDGEHGERQHGSLCTPVRARSQCCGSGSPRLGAGRWHDEGSEARLFLATYFDKPLVWKLRNGPDWRIHAKRKCTHGDVPTMEASKQERQLLEMMREWIGDNEYRVEIKCARGAWEIELLSASRGGKNQKWARGFGSTFGEAWDNMAPGWA